MAHLPPDLPTDTTGPVAAERPKERKGNAEQKMIKKNQKGGPSKSIRKQHAAHAPAVSNNPSEETRSKPRKVASKQSQRDKNRQSQREDQKSVAQDGWSIVPGHPPKRLRIIQEQVDDPNAYRSLRKVETPTPYSKDTAWSGFRNNYSITSCSLATSSGQYGVGCTDRSLESK